MALGWRGMVIWKFPRRGYNFRQIWKWLTVQVSELVDSVGFPLDDLISEVDDQLASSVSDSAKMVAARALVDKFKAMLAQVNVLKEYSLAFFYPY